MFLGFRVNDWGISGRIEHGLIIKGAGISGLIDRLVDAVVADGAIGINER